jgi:hypothetical protein
VEEEEEEEEAFKKLDLENKKRQTDTLNKSEDV